MTNRNDEIAIILERIVVLQRAAVREEIEERHCDQGFLGDIVHEEGCNTRPIVIFTDDDRPWRCPIDREDDGCNSCCGEETCIFRVEKVVNNSVVLRALRDTCCRGCRRLESTNSFVTIRIANIAALRCLRDTFVNLCLQ